VFQKYRLDTAINLDPFSEPECLHSITAFLKYSGGFLLVPHWLSPKLF